MELEKIANKKAGETTMPASISRPEMGEIGDCRLPIAMGYVPAQRGSKRYEPMEALDRGTLYPGLDLPFKNNYEGMKLANTESNELMSYGFAIAELGLYLNTNKDDDEAFQLYRALVNSYNKMREDYVMKNGPIGKFDVTDSKKYQWTNDPWPWERGDV
ncbi:MAG: spore coat protein CotJB [Oscillospiraceae bacterium]|nr:spore coat protein CotJB [Oscillospiraceae bacterium]